MLRSIEKLSRYKILASDGNIGNSLETPAAGKRGTDTLKIATIKGAQHERS